MKSGGKAKHPARRRGTPRELEGAIPRTRVLRPFEKWLINLLRNERWVDSKVSFGWLDRCRELAAELGCGLRFDIQSHWYESVYVTDYRGHGPTVLAGGAGDPKIGCTAILHELGHHVLLSRRQSSKNVLVEEEAAWGIAKDLAMQHHLPLISQIKRRALYSYQLAALLEENSGSKRRRKRRPLPKSWILELSKRSAAISTGTGLLSMGKKGRRHAKRFLKRQTARGERRQPVVDE